MSLRAASASFAHHLHGYARHAALSGSGICWEYSGDFPLAEMDFMSATITIITSYIESPKQFKGLDFYERRQSSVGWKEFPSRSGRLPGHILIRATS